MSGECNVCGHQGCVEDNHPHAGCDTRIAYLEQQVRVLDDHFDAANYGCPHCGVHHGCFEMVAENELLRGILRRLHETCAAGVTGHAIYSEDDEAGSKKIARGLTPAQVALFDDIAKESE